MTLDLKVGAAYHHITSVESSPSREFNFPLSDIFPKNIKKKLSDSKLKDLPCLRAVGGRGDDKFVSYQGVCNDV